MNVFYSINGSAKEWISSKQLYTKWRNFSDWKEKFRTIPGFKTILFFADAADPSAGKNPEELSLAEQECRFIFVSRDPVPGRKTIELLNNGFSDVICWNGKEKLAEYLEEKSLRLEKIEQVLDSTLIAENLAGRSKTWRNFLRNVIETAVFSASNILILGESGTGKELLSRLVHTLDKREDKSKLILLDCSTIAPELSGSEFFGHERGSYTSAVAAREGAFSLANKGTLFLDEIGELPLRMQAELLRVIQEGSFKKVGSNNWQETSFRLVSATNRDLKSMIEEKFFRSDLYYRISDVVFRVPSLEERSDDIRPLAAFFLHQYYAEQKMQVAVPDFDESVLQLIESRHYAGNVRELRQLVRRIAMRHTGKGVVTMAAVPPEERCLPEDRSTMQEKLQELELIIRKAVLKGEGLSEIKNMAAFAAIKAALEMEAGNRQKAADRLNITTRAIQQYFKKSSGEIPRMN